MSRRGHIVFGIFYALVIAIFAALWLWLTPAHAQAHSEAARLAMLDWKMTTDDLLAKARDAEEVTTSV